MLVWKCVACAVLFLLTPWHALTEWWVKMLKCEMSLSPIIILIILIWLTVISVSTIFFSDSVIRVDWVMGKDAEMWSVIIVNYIPINATLTDCNMFQLFYFWLSDNRWLPSAERSCWNVKRVIFILISTVPWSVININYITINTVLTVISVSTIFCCSFFLTSWHALTARVLREVAEI